MNIRKYFNIQNKNERNVIKHEIGLIWNSCQKIADVENKELKEAKVIHDGNCPNCRSKKNIVNKIAFIESTTKTITKLNFGVGSVEIINNINTSEVNHCNECGNEWVKFKVKNVLAENVLMVILNYLSQVLTNPEERNRSWKMEAVEIFKDCYAESIYKLRNKYETKLPEKTYDKLNLTRLRKNYKSIFD